MSRPQSSTGTINLEIQVLRDLQALSRPTIAHLGADHAAFHVVLPRGYAAAAEHIAVELTLLGHLHESWMAGTARLWIDNIPIGVARPMVFCTEPTDTPTGLVHITPVAADDHPTLGGWHTITLRTASTSGD